MRADRRLKREGPSLTLFAVALVSFFPQTLARRASEGQSRHAFFPRIPLLALRASVACATSKLTLRVTPMIVQDHLERFQRKCSGYFAVWTRDLRRPARYTSVRLALAFRYIVAFRESQFYV
jgi:hypothetical protein